MSAMKEFMLICYHVFEHIKDTEAVLEVKLSGNQPYNFSMQDNVIYYVEHDDTFTIKAHIGKTLKQKATKMVKFSYNVKYGVATVLNMENIEVPELIN